jgi:hypothetical protein
MTLGLSLMASISGKCQVACWICKLTIGQLTNYQFRRKLIQLNCFLRMDSPHNKCETTFVRSITYDKCVRNKDELALRVT